MARVDSELIGVPERLDGPAGNPAGSLLGAFRLRTLVTRLAVASVALGGLGLLVSMFLGVADVIGTSMGAPVPGALEMTESTMVLVVFGGLAYAQIRRSHIRVELVYLRAGPKLRSVMDLVAVLSALVFFGLLGWQGFNEALYSWSIAEATSGIIRFPLYPARFLLVFGAFLMLVQLLLDLWDIITHFGQSAEIEAG